MDVLFQKSKFIQEKKDNLYNSLFNVEKNKDISPVSPDNTVTPHVVEPVTPDDNNVPPPSAVDTTINPNNNQNIIMQNQGIQIGGYKKMQKQLFKNINNIITVKLTIYSSNKFENSFIKKIRYSQ